MTSKQVWNTEITKYIIYFVSSSLSKFRNFIIITCFLYLILYFCIFIKVAISSSSFGLGLVSNFQKHLVMVCSDRTRKPFFKNFAIFFSNFFSNFLKNMKIQYKNTLNQTKIRISQNLMFKNDNNIIFREFENIL